MEKTRIETLSVAPQDFLVTACLLSLASNVSAAQNLALAHAQLKKLGKLQVSQNLISAAAAKNQSTLNQDAWFIPDYHNQMAYLALAKPMIYLDLVALTKNIEQQASRQAFAKPLVALDVDIIAIKPQLARCSGQDEHHMEFLPLNDGWLGIARRLPLASYDWACYTSLMVEQQGQWLPLLTARHAPAFCLESDLLGQ